MKNEWLFNLIAKTNKHISSYQNREWEVTIGTKKKNMEVDLSWICSPRGPENRSDAPGCEPRHIYAY